MKLRGILADVTPAVEASATTGAVASGETVVPVKSLNPFLDAGGICLVFHDEEPQTYTYGVDEAAGAVVVDPPLTGDVEDGEPVYSLSDTSQDESTVWLWVQLDDGGDPVPIAAPSTLRMDKLDLSLLIGTEVEVESTADGYRSPVLLRETPALDRSILRTPLISLELPANQTIASGVLTTITGWGGTEGTTSGGRYGRFASEIARSFGADGVDIDAPGAYLAIATIDWANNTSGGRTANLMLERDGVDIDETQAAGAPASGGRSTQQVSRLFVAEGNETIRVDVSQSSGADLDVRTALTTLQVMQVAMT